MKKSIIRVVAPIIFIIMASLDNDAMSIYQVVIMSTLVNIMFTLFDMYDIMNRRKDNNAK